MTYKIFTSETVEARRAPTPRKHPVGEVVPGRELGLLQCRPNREGLQHNRWATYKQIKDMGGQVRKGEKATQVLFYKFDDERKAQQPGAVDKPATSPEGPAERERSRPPMVRCYAVFNVEQADGLKLERRDEDRTTSPSGKCIRPPSASSRRAASPCATNAAIAPSTTCRPTR